MDKNKLNNSIGNIDDDLISKADADRMKKHFAAKRRKTVVMYAGIAACFLLAVTLGWNELAPHLGIVTDKTDGIETNEKPTNDYIQPDMRPESEYGGNSNVSGTLGKPEKTPNIYYSTENDNISANSMIYGALGFFLGSGFYYNKTLINSANELIISYAYANQSLPNGTLKIEIDAGGFIMDQDKVFLISDFTNKIKLNERNSCQYFFRLGEENEPSDITVRYSYVLDENYIINGKNIEAGTEILLKTEKIKCAFEGSYILFER